jgi:hypothetical protein
MTPERHPWFKFHTSDWRGDDKLRSCGLAAQGLWINCLAIMHAAEPRGYLLSGGEPIAIERLALMVSRPLKEVRKALAELERYGVSSRSEAGHLYSRRMVRDTARLQTLTENGRRGGNPTLLVNQGDAVLVNQTLNSARVTHPLASRDLVSSLPALDLSVSDRPPDPERALLAARFETFWTAYPCKKAKKDAERAFHKLRPDHELLGVLLDAITRQKLTRQWLEGVYPHAATWLNGERWRDEVVPDAGPVRGAFSARPDGPPPPPPAAEVLAKMGMLA